MTEHALLSASSSERWLACPGSVALCKDIPRTSSKFADRGTLAHSLASTILSGEGSIAGVKAEDYIGLSFGDTEMEVDKEMAEDVQAYVDYVRQFTAGGTLMVEKRVDYSSYIGVPGSFGTADAVIVSPDGKEVTVVDLKTGKGVRVDAEENSQLMLYALGTLDELSVMGNEIERVRLVIHQPPLDNISEWDCSIEHLLEFAMTARRSAELAMNVFSDEKWDDSILIPGESQCRWCPAKAGCPALAQFVQDNIGGGFDDVSEMEAIPVSNDNLSAKMKATPIIEDWCKAIRGKVEAELLAGNAVEGFKLVAGRKGARSWVDADTVEELLKSFRLKQEEIYDFSLISPTTAEKRLKDQPRRWSKLEEMITRKDGSPSVAPASDKRPALTVTPVEEGFDDVSE